MIRVLALEPYYGGSHRAFLDGWTARSRHAWTSLTLPPHKWKWRMRHTAITFAQEIQIRCARGERWDLVFASDMLDMATFRALTSASVATAPRVVYFHENQLTYPVQADESRDYHFGFTNFTSTLAAQAVWFNSQYHCDSFFDALSQLLQQMPDHLPQRALERARQNSAIHAPGIESFPPRQRRNPRPLHILWAARWEHDKNPTSFFRALAMLKSRGVDFRLSALGEQFRHTPPAFADAQSRFSEHIDRWGYQSSRQDYVDALLEADVFVSTALHEFFGIAAVEAISAGAYPLLPNRLSYPELLGLAGNRAVEQHYYDGSESMLSDRLIELAQQHQIKGNLAESTAVAQQLVKRFEWDRLAPAMDSALENIVKDRQV